MGPKPDFVNNVITLAHLKADNKATGIGVSSDTKPNLFLSVRCIFCSMKGRFFSMSPLSAPSKASNRACARTSREQIWKTSQALVNAGRWICQVGHFGRQIGGLIHSCGKSRGWGLSDTFKVLWTSSMEKWGTKKNLVTLLLPAQTKKLKSFSRCTFDLLPSKSFADWLSQQPFSMGWEQTVSLASVYHASLSVPEQALKSLKLCDLHRFHSVSPSLLMIFQW